MAKTVTPQLEIGGEWRSGDPLSIPENHVLSAKNVVVKAGRYFAKRAPWTRDGSTVGGSNFSVYQAAGSATQTLVSTFKDGVPNGNLQYRDAAGVWQTGKTGQIEGRDHAMLGNLLYGVNVLNNPEVYSFTGTSVTNSATAEAIGGETICAFNKRLYVGNVTILTTNLATSDFNAATWAKTAGWVTALGGTIVTVTPAASADYTTLGNFTRTNAGYVTWTQYFRALHATNRCPIHMQIIDVATGVTLSEQYFELASRSENPDWQISPALTAYMPAGTQYKIRVGVADGGVLTPFVAGTTFQICDTAAGVDKGACLTEGRFAYPPTTNASLTTAYPTRFYYHSVDDTAFWKANYYVDCQEIRGGITVMRSGNGRLAVYGLRDVYTFRPADDNDVPVQLENKYHGFGCRSTRAITIYEDTHYFIGENEVYSWDVQGEPTRLAGDGMREWLFNRSTLVTRPVIALDALHKLLYCYIRQNKISVLNLTTNDWTHFTVTGAADAELPIYDMWWGKVNGDTVERLWVRLLNTFDVAKENTAATQDTPEGTARDVVAEIVWRPFAAGHPRQLVYPIEGRFFHKITGSQAGCLTRLSSSFDDGTTWSYYDEDTIAPLSTGGVETWRQNIQEQGPRVTIGLKHTGSGGENYFNVYGGDVEIQILGRETPASNPTASGSSL